MSRRQILSVDKPATQAIDSVKALLTWRGRASDPLPSFIEMGEGDSRLVLVLSNKKDAYYTVTARACSCPAAIYHHGPCKHQRQYFPDTLAATKPVRSIIPERKAFKPFIEDEERKPAKEPSSIPLVDCLPDPTARDVAYHEMKIDREMWPVEA